MRKYCSQLWKRKLEKNIKDLKGSEPIPSAIPVQCFPNLAIKPIQLPTPEAMRRLGRVRDCGIVWPMDKCFFRHFLGVVFTLSIIVFTEKSQYILYNWLPRNSLIHRRNFHPSTQMIPQSLTRFSLPIVSREGNGPFAANGHMLQNPPCWRASCALGHAKQRKFKFDWMKALCFECPCAQLALQHCGFYTIWPLAANGPLITAIASL